jgi:hypothetical protein
MLNGKEVPAQFRVTGLWRPDQSIRWLLVDFQTDINANEKQRYQLEYGPAVKREASPACPVLIAQDDGRYTIDTGQAVFRVSKRVFSLFDEVTLAGGTVLVGPSAEGAARFAAEIKGFQANVTRPVSLPSNKGSSHLIYATNLGGNEIEDYTLRFDTDSEYALAGAKSGAAGRGTFGQDFVNSDGKLSIPKDAWLAYARPKAGDAYTFRAVPRSASAASEGVFDTAIIESRPLRSVIRVKGSFGLAIAAAMEYRLTGDAKYLALARTCFWDRRPRRWTRD